MKNKTEKTESLEPAATDMATALLASMEKMQKAGLGPLRWFGIAWLENFGELNREVAEFVAARIKEDVRTQHEILHCKDAARLREIQARFVQTAIDQYTIETGKMVKLGEGFLDQIKQNKDS